MNELDAMWLWWVIRATGATSLLLLTASLVLGIAANLRWRPDGMPVSVSRSLHRNVGLLSVSFIAVHVLGSVANVHAGVSLLDMFVPLAHEDYGIDLALGTVAFDLLLAVAATGGLRGRLGTRTWKLVHWVSYACWPVAVLHGIGMGTDAGSWWLLVVVGACVVATLGAVTMRVRVAARGMLRA